MLVALISLHNMATLYLISMKISMDKHRVGSSWKGSLGQHVLRCVSKAYSIVMWDGMLCSCEAESIEVHVCSSLQWIGADFLSVLLVLFVHG